MEENSRYILGFFFTFEIGTYQLDTETWNWNPSMTMSYRNTDIFGWSCHCTNLGRGLRLVTRQKTDFCSLQFKASVFSSLPSSFTRSVLQDKVEKDSEKSNCKHIPDPEVRLNFYGSCQISVISLKWNQVSLLVDFRSPVIKRSNLWPSPTAIQG